MTPPAAWPAPVGLLRLWPRPGRAARLWHELAGWTQVYIRRVRYRNGREVDVAESGFPLVPHPDDGWSPVDDERARWADGTEFRREDWSRAVDDEEEHGVRILTRPGAPPLPAAVWPGAGDHDSKVWLGERLAATAVAQTNALRTIEVRLADDPERSALPDLIRRRAVYTSLRMADRSRRRLIDRHRAVRERVEARLAAFAVHARAAYGVTAEPLKGASGPWLHVTGPAKCLRALLADPDVIRATEAGGGGLDYMPVTAELCGPSRAFDASTDISDACEGEGTSGAGLLPYNHLANTMLGAQAYLEVGYHGEGIAGLAQGWDAGEDQFGRNQRHLTLAMFDIGLAPGLPAFQVKSGGDTWNRVKIYADDFIGWLVDDASINALRPTVDDVDHGTQVTAVAMGNITDLQDLRVASARDQAARSGVAQRASAFFCDTRRTAATCLAYIQDPELVGDANHVYGVDVVNVCGWHGGCADKNVAFGIDAVSEAFTDAYLDRSVLTVKSAGNLFGTDERHDSCWDKRQIQAPAASPAVLTVGAYDYNRSRYTKDRGGPLDPPVTASAGQMSSYLTGNSSGGHTGDGRVHPLLVAPHWSCGNATAKESGGSYPGVATTPGMYSGFGATSGATPRVAGGAVLFKHWYISKHGADFGNAPGRVMSNLLNMADGVVFETTLDPANPPNDPARKGEHDQERRVFGARTTAPENAWGLGHVRMRLFEGSGMAGPWLRGTTTVVLSDSHPAESISLGQGGVIPREARRLRITMWWIDVNTGPGEDKARLSAWVYDGTADAGLASASSSGNHVMRIDFDCYDYFARRPCPSGDIHLFLFADTVPTEVRHPRRDYRTVYVSWYYESGPDVSLIDCPGSEVDLCDVLSPKNSDPTRHLDRSQA